MNPDGTTSFTAMQAATNTGSSIATTSSTGLEFRFVFDGARERTLCERLIILRKLPGMQK